MEITFDKQREHDVGVQGEQRETEEDKQVVGERGVWGEVAVGEPLMIMIIFIVIVVIKYVRDISFQMWHLTFLLVLVRCHSLY